MAGAGADVERDRETTELFIEESMEGLQRVEEILLKAEGGAPDKAGLDELFRDFHTIKGTSGFLAFSKIQRLGHAAEDLLSCLRDGSLIPEAAHFALLVRVVDVLREMVKCVREIDEEGDADVEPLVASLREALAYATTEEETYPAPVATAVAKAPVAQAPLPASPHVQQKENRAASPQPLPAAARSADAAIEAKPKEAAPKPKGHDAKQADQDTTVRVHVTLLDRLMNLMGELVLARNQIVQMHRDTDTGSAVQRLSLVTSELQEQIMKTRLQPVARVFEKIPRMARDLSQACGKQVVVEVDGTSTEIDKALVEAIRDPVMHIVRNALDHGIESPEKRLAAGKPVAGRLRIAALHEGGMVSITIQDDGAGIDPAKLRAKAVEKGLLSLPEASSLGDREALDLIFHPGFSTAEKVTDISGRGVGMDVVRSNVVRAGGKVELESKPGEGTLIRLKMPLTLAIVPALLVRSCGQRFAIPQVDLLELVRLEDDELKAIEYIREAPIYRLRGEILPLVRLGSLLRLEAPDSPLPSSVHIVVVSAGASRCGLVVDGIEDTQEIVVKPLHKEVKRIGVYSGATVLGDGGVALILDVLGVTARAGIDAAARRLRAQAEETQEASGRSPYIVFTAGSGQQCMVPLSMVSRLERVAPHKIEAIAGAEVLQYRDEVVPVMRPERLLPLGETIARDGPVPLIIFDFGQPLAMAVDEIVDVVESDVDLSRLRGMVPLTLGKTIVLKRTTLVLDVYAMARVFSPTFVREEKRTVARKSRMLLADDSSAMRSAISGFLRSQGLDVVDVPSGQAALKELEAGQFDILITDLEMADVDGLGVLKGARARRPDLPVIVWTFHDDPAIAAKMRAAGARACINKLCREDLMAELAALGILQTGAERAA